MTVYVAAGLSAMPWKGDRETFESLDRKPGREEEWVLKEAAASRREAPVTATEARPEAGGTCRERLLSAATSLFARRGYEATTVKECIANGMAKINFGTMLRNNYLKYYDEAYHTSDHQGHPWRCMPV